MDLKCSCATRWCLSILAGFLLQEKISINIWISGTWSMAIYTFLLLNQNVLVWVQYIGHLGPVQRWSHWWIKPFPCWETCRGQTGYTLWQGAAGPQKRYSNQPQLQSWQQDCYHTLKGLTYPARQPQNYMKMEDPQVWQLSGLLSSFPESISWKREIIPKSPDGPAL